MDVKIEISQGPVYMRWLEGKGLSNEINLWGGIIGHEFFPRNVESANYVLTLKKPVNSAPEVLKVESELAEALTKLSEAWIFSGGSLFPITEKKTINQPLYSSNAEEVEKELLAKEGKVKVSSSMTSAWSCGCTYYDAPLSKAVAICRASFERPEMQRIVKYYTEARLYPEKWFIDLYKIRDTLKSVYGNDKATINSLNIDKDDAD